MKNIFAIFLALLIFSSCTKLEDFNKNTKDPTKVPGESLFTGAQHRLANQVVTPNVNNNICRMFVQQWTETTYIDEANYDIVTRPIPGNHWDVLYRDVLQNLKESAKVLKADGTKPGDKPEVLTNKLAIVEIMSVYTWSILVETFGDVPYTEALNFNEPLPKYDDGLSIYKDLISRLNAAIASMDQTAGSFGGPDNMFQGDVTLWYKFANSLKLRMGMLLADVDPALAQSTVESAAPNAISSNAENAKMGYLVDQPNNNPINENLVLSGRNDFVAANTLVDAMNDLNDPRRPLFFTPLSDGTYSGGIYGASNDFTKFSHVADAIQVGTFPITFFDYAETEFLLAEGAARGYAVGAVEEHYNKAITASILDWGGTTEDVTAYLADPKVAYATATGDWKQKIGTQYWIALYNRGLEGWTTWRRLDYPVLLPPETAEPPGSIPVRLTYPVAEQTLNGSNRGAAASAIGGDVVDTKLFWDKH